MDAIKSSGFGARPFPNLGTGGPEFEAALCRGTRSSVFLRALCGVRQGTMAPATLVPLTNCWFMLVLNQ